MSEEDRTIEVDEYIDAPPAEAFEYLADPDRRAFGDGQVELGDELSRETPSRIAWEVTTVDGTSRRAGTVEIEVAPEGTGSRVRVIHEIASAASRGPRAELALAS